MEKARRFRSIEEAERLLLEYEGSGQSRQEFCQQRGITLQSMDRYRRRIVRAKGLRKCKTGLVPVVVKASGVERVGAPGFTLVLANGRRIETAWSYGEAELAKLIRIAEAA